jgi:hypothetical protein
MASTMGLIAFMRLALRAARILNGKSSALMRKVVATIDQPQLRVTCSLISRTVHSSGRATGASMP